ncbi:MAG: ribosomal L7Ae/L30e/S12e/Gadd45 family protein [Clostridia bacterium]|nr:ribosomal L7Ae/L30e/S12e/Gadd45 family protein [Clostridia bacterium]
MDDKEKILRFLGLAVRAGSVESGFDAVAGCIAKGNAKMLIIARDISRNTLNKFLDLSSKADMPERAYSFGTMEELGEAMGKNSRALIAITDKGFADKLSSMLEVFEYKEEDN